MARIGDWEPARSAQSRVVPRDRDQVKWADLDCRLLEIDSVLAEIALGIARDWPESA